TIPQCTLGGFAAPLAAVTAPLPRRRAIVASCSSVNSLASLSSECLAWIVCAGRPHARSSNIEAADTRAAGGAASSPAIVESVLMASGECSRAISSTSRSAFGRPPGLPDWPLTKRTLRIPVFRNAVVAGPWARTYPQRNSAELEQSGRRTFGHSSLCAQLEG